MTKIIIVNAFKNLLTNQGEGITFLEGLSFSTLNVSKTHSLKALVFEEKIRVALMEANGDKALGPNGYIMAFRHFCWDIVKGEVLSVFQDLFETTKFVKCFEFYFHCVRSRRRKVQLTLRISVPLALWVVFIS